MDADCSSPTTYYQPATGQKRGVMQSDDLLPHLIAQQFQLYGEAAVSRANAAKLIATHGDTIRSNFFEDPPSPLVTIRPVRTLEMIR